MQGGWRITDRVIQVCREHPIFGFCYKLVEHPNFVVAYPEDEGDVVFIVDKKKHPHWKHAISHLLPTPFPEFRVEGILVTQMCPDGSLQLSEGENTKKELVIRNDKLMLVTDYVLPALVRVDWELLPPGIIEDWKRGDFTGIPDYVPEDQRRFDRLMILAMNEPDACHTGKVMNQRRAEYIVAQYSRLGLWIADNPYNGNALFYITKQECEQRGTSWRRVLGQKKKVAEQLGAHRIEHKGNWELVIRQLFI